MDTDLLITLQYDGGTVQATVSTTVNFVDCRPKNTWLSDSHFDLYADTPVELSLTVPSDFNTLCDDYNSYEFIFTDASMDPDPSGFVTFDSINPNKLTIEISSSEMDSVGHEAYILYIRM